MPVIRLDSLDDPQLADYKAVRDPELLHTRKLFVAELIDLKLAALLGREDPRAEYCHPALTIEANINCDDPVVYMLRMASQAR